MANKQVVVVDGDDAAPEAMGPSVALLESMDLPIDFERPLIGQAAIDETGSGFPEEAKAAIDASDATFFGSTSGACTAALFYLRWGRETYANVRPCRWIPGYRSPLATPDGIDFVIIRENLEDLYLGLEGELSDLAGLNLSSRNSRKPIADMGPGKYAIKAITEAGSERVIRYAFELAKKRHKKRKVTLTCKYNMLHVSDGLFLKVGQKIADDYPDIEFETYIIDDFLCRMITRAHDLDVVVMPNLYGDIMSDGAAGLMGGLGLAASGCYGDDYAYFESAHGTAPDIAGMNIINPTATLVSAAMMLDYLGFAEAAGNLTAAISRVYREGTALTPDQGGNASTTDFCHAVERYLS